MNTKNKMVLTKKIKIFPTKKQQEVLWDLSEKCRLIYNFALSERIENWEENKEKTKEERKYITYIDQQNKLPKLKELYPEYKWVYSKVLQMTLRKLNDNYKSFFALWKNGDKTARTPHYKGKKHFTTLCYNQKGFKLSNDTISFVHKHPSKIPLSFKMPENLIPKGKIKQIDIYLKEQLHWFISIYYEFETPYYKDNGLYLAIDLGILQTTGVNLYGKTIQFKHRRADLYWRKKLREVQSKRDHCKKFSKRWQRYNSKFKKMKKRQSNQLKDFQHYLSNKIVKNTKANTIIIGDLKVKQMAKKRKGTGSSFVNSIIRTTHHSIQNTGYMSRFAKFLTYKSEKLGKRVIRIDESKTTQVCCVCGKKERRKLYKRTINCDCGNQFDRDINSAINIMTKFLINKEQFDFLLHKPSLNEEFFLNLWKGFTTIYSPIAKDSGFVESY